jgi:hypothetical protein
MIFNVVVGVLILLMASVMPMKDVLVLTARINKITVQTVLSVVVQRHLLHVVQVVKHGIQVKVYVK